MLSYVQTNTLFKKSLKKIRRQQITVLPQRSLASTTALWSSNNWTTSVLPWQAARCKAVRLSMSWKLTSVPEFRSSLIPSKSPSLAKYISPSLELIASCSSASASSVEVAAAFSSLSGARDDCLNILDRAGGLGLGLGFVSIYKYTILCAVSYLVIVMGKTQRKKREYTIAC